MTAARRYAAIPQGKLTAEKACQGLAALQPEGAIIVDEGVSSAFAYYALSHGLPPHDMLLNSGGAIGYGLPCAIGAAMACPDRPVLNLQADGSAMYTVQALWTQARQRLNVTTLVCANRSYGILKMEVARPGSRRTARISPPCLTSTTPTWTGSKWRRPWGWRRCPWTRASSWPLPSGSRSTSRDPT